MRNAIIYVFTGTKNTLLTADMIASQFSLNGYDTIIHEVTRPFTNVPMPCNYDFVGFGYPVHAYNAPQVFLEFVKCLPAVNHTKSFIFKTSGEPFRYNNASSYMLLKILNDKNFNVLLEQHLLMPYNIIFRYNDSLVKQMYLTSNAQCKLFVSNLLKSKTQNFRFHIVDIVVSMLLRIEWFGAKFNGKLFSINNRRCICCMKCVKACPTNNIIYKDGKFHFAGMCTMCMRCVMFCPTNAIRPGLIHPLKINGAYNFTSLLKDNSIPAIYICGDTKGYFRLFQKYYTKVNKELAKANINIVK